MDIATLSSRCYSAAAAEGLWRMVMKRKCTVCGKDMVLLEQEFGLIAMDDLPSHGSRTEIMISPKKLLQVQVLQCGDPACATLQFIRILP